jgi:hypothetical protein
MIGFHSRASGDSSSPIFNCQYSVLCLVGRLKLNQTQNHGRGTNFHRVMWLFGKSTGRAYEL